MEGGLEAAKLNHDVIMAPNSYCYFDYYQTQDTQNEPFAIGGYVPVERLQLRTVPAELTPNSKNIF